MSNPQIQTAIQKAIVDTVRQANVELFNEIVQSPERRCAFLINIHEQLLDLCAVPVEMYEQLLAAEEAHGPNLGEHYSPMQKKMAEAMQRKPFEKILEGANKGREMGMKSLRKVIEMRKLVQQ
jgi:hypothetical protein